MPNDRVQLRPPRRYLAASGDLCSNPQNLLLEKAFDIRACVIDVPSVVKPLRNSPQRARSPQRLTSPRGGESANCKAVGGLDCKVAHKLSTADPNIRSTTPGGD